MVVKVHVGSAEYVAVIVHDPAPAGTPEKEYGIDVAKGGVSTIGAPPHELVIVNVPVVGGVVVVIVPVTVNVLVAGTHAPGFAVNPVILHKIAQLVVPSTPSASAATAVMLVGAFEKLVTNSIYHCPAIAPTIFTCSVAAAE